MLIAQYRFDSEWFFFYNTTYPTQIQVFNLRKILFVIESFQFDSYNT